MSEKNSDILKDINLENLRHRLAQVKQSLKKVDELQNNLNHEMDALQKQIRILTNKEGVPFDPQKENFIERITPTSVENKNKKRMKI